MEKDNIDAIIIGGGVSGIAAAKSMRDAGFSVQLLERTGDIGGLWKFKEKAYGVMSFTHINVSKENYSFSDFPFDESVEDYPHNQQMAQYIQDYVKHFSVDKCIQFYTQVNEIKREGSSWIVTTERTVEDKDGIVTPTGEVETLTCKYIAIATGHHAKPVYASFPGLDKFKGTVIHSVDFNDAEYNQIKGKKIVIVGIGNSAIDAATNCATVGRVKPVYLSTRSGAWVLPNYLFARPIDHYSCRAFLWLPWKLGNFILETVISAIHGHPKKWGLNPTMKALQTQPTVSPTAIHHIQRGEIKIKPNIESVGESTIKFTDGTSVEADYILLCTGYKIALPFLPQDITKHILNNETNEIKLFQNVFSPEVGHSLAFIGFVQPASGGVITMSETQSRWWAELCRGSIRMQSKDFMLDHMAQEKERTKSRWVNRGRHTIQKDPILYNDEIASYFGAKPDIMKHKRLAWRLLLSSCGASQWRLQGPGQWPRARAEVLKVQVTGLLHYSAIFVVILVIYFAYLMLCKMCDMVDNVFDCLFD